MRRCRTPICKAQISDTNLEGADLSKADLRYADLHNVKWPKIANLKLANIFGVRNSPADFNRWALQQGAVSLESDDEWAKLEDQ